MILYSLVRLLKKGDSIRMLRQKRKENSMKKKKAGKGESLRRIASERKMLPEVEKRDNVNRRRKRKKRKMRKMRIVPAQIKILRNGESLNLDSFLLKRPSST